MARPKPNRAERSRRTTIFLCVVASVTFWLSIKLSETYTSLEPIALEYRLPGGLAFAQAPPNMLEASVRATGWELLIQSFRTRERGIVIDSTDIGASPDGIISIRRAVAQAFAEEGLAVDAMTDERVVLKMERVASKRVPLRLVSDISYAGGFRSSRAPRLTPDSVTLTGPASLIDTVGAWPSDTLTLRDVQDTVAAVALPEQPTSPALTVAPTTIEVTVESQQFTEKRMYVPVELSGKRRRDSIALFPAQVLVSFPVGLDDYERVRASDFRVEVDVSEVGQSGDVRLPVMITSSPEGIGKPVVQPRTVEVYLRRE